MDFINIILANSSMKEAKLYAAAKRASENPLIGITIQNQAAFHVIKDCANIACRYLPLFVFDGYARPFDELAGKFRKQHIVDFVINCKTDKTLKQLLDVILHRIQDNVVAPVVSVPQHTSSDFQSDPYGDYAFYTEDAAEQPVGLRQTSNNPVDILIDSFKAVD